ncbi:MAG: N-6 DNA methylase [Phycisphaerae bacterium]
MTAAIAPSPAPSNFFSSGLRQKVDQLMDILWSGGVANPATSIEQISYLLFLRLLTERDEQKARIAGKSYKRIFSGKWSSYAWHNFITLTGQELFSAVRQAIESLHELPDLSRTGQLLFQRATLKIFDIPSLKAVINTIHSLDLAEHDGPNGDKIDLKGDMYEYLLSRLAVSGTNGQFRTPRHIIDMIVKLVDPQPHHRICDPACGTAASSSPPTPTSSARTPNPPTSPRAASTAPNSNPPNGPSSPNTPSPASTTTPTWSRSPS